jgi:hypothetical protein
MECGAIVDSQSSGDASLGIASVALAQLALGKESNALVLW